MIDPRYPIGRFQDDGRHDASARSERIAAIRSLPGEVRSALDGIDEDGLEAVYREGGWTVRQVCHHLADSHVNAYVRTRLAVTSPEAPTIVPYSEQAWAELPDVQAAPVDTSLRLLEGLHERWAAFFEGLREEDWDRAYVHPESGRAVSVGRVLALYAWHGRHHVAHVQVARGRPVG